MKSERSFLFPPFQVDTIKGSLFRDSQEIVLRAKTFAVLCYLLERAGQLVSKDELLGQVWAGTYVAEGALTVCMTELRKALGDDAKNPRFIATVPKRGYRFIAKVDRSQPSVVSSKEEARDWRLETSSFPTQAPSLKPLAPSFVGRDAELTQLHQWFDRAHSGRRQVVFVTGEPGIGKTTLIEAFLAQLETRDWGLEAGPPSSQASSLKPQVCCWAGGNASSITELAKHICQFWMPSSNCAMPQEASDSLTSSAVMPRRGWFRCQPYSMQLTWKPCSAESWALLANACCAR